MLERLKAAHYRDESLADAFIRTLCSKTQPEMGLMHSAVLLPLLSLKNNIYTCVVKTIRLCVKGQGSGFLLYFLPALQL